MINVAGTFRGHTVDGGLSYSSGGFLQLTALLHVDEYYDEDLGEWVAWEYDENEITAYLIMIDSKDQKTLNWSQIEKAFEWDASSFEELEEKVVAQHPVQFRIAEKIYQEKTNLQVEWIDEYDATPGRVVRKLDPVQSKQLYNKYAKFLKTAKAPVKAPPKAPLAAVKAKEAIGEAMDEAKAKPKPPKTAAPKPPKTTAPKSSGNSKQEVWDTCVEFRRDDVTDQQLAEAWTSVINEVAPNKTDAQITPEEWGIIGDKVLDKVGKF